MNGSEWMNGWKDYKSNAIVKALPTTWLNVERLFQDGELYVLRMGFYEWE